VCHPCMGGVMARRRGEFQGVSCHPCMGGVMPRPYIYFGWKPAPINLLRQGASGY